MKYYYFRFKNKRVFYRIIHKIFIIKLLFIFLAIYQTSIAQTDTSNIINNLHNLSLDELLKVRVISSTKKSQKVSEAPSIISVLTREEITKMGAITLIDVLKFIPAIEISLDATGFYRVAIRGIRKDGNILVLIDNLPINEFYDGKSFYDLPVNFIDKVEIIRGPGSALFGTNAIVGVINILTIRKQNEISVNVGTGYLYSGNINFAKRINKANFSISTGYNSWKGINQNPYSDLRSSNTNRWLKDSYLITSLSRNNFDFQIIGLYRNQGPWVGPLFEPAPDSDFKNGQIQTFISYKIGNEKFTITPKINYQYINHDYLIQEHAKDYRTSLSGIQFTDGALVKEYYNSHKLSSEIQFNYNFSKKLNFIGGFLFEKLNISDYDLLRNYKISSQEYKGIFGNYDNAELNQKGKTRDIYATYLQTQFELDKLTFILGLRYDRYSDFGNSFNPRVGFIYKLSKSLNIKALYGQAFRSPTFKELYDKTSYNNYDGVVGNQFLKPEEIQSAEIGIEYQHSTFYIRANAFYNNNINIIDIWDEAQAGTIGVFENIGDIKSYGAESEIRLFITKQINLNLNVSYFIKKFDYNSNTMFDLQRRTMYERGSRFMKNTPGLRINSSIFYSYKKFSIFAGINYGGIAASNKRGQTEFQFYADIPSYIQFNFCILYSPFQNIDLKISGINIGEKFSDPDESSNIGKFGIKGMRQPADYYTASIIYKF